MRSVAVVGSVQSLSLSLAVAAQHEGGDPRVVGREVVGEGVPPPRPEQRHRVQGDDDVDRVVVARGEDEDRLLRD